MRILVAGVGAVGGWLLARITEAGADATGWARGETYARLHEGQPLVLQSKDGDWSGPVRVVLEPDGAYDLTLVCTKSAQTAEVARSLFPGGVVVSAQNGIDNPGVLAANGQADRVVASVVYSGCRRIDPVTIRHTSNGVLVTDDDEVAAWMSGVGLSVRVVADVRSEQWRKLASNVASNSLTAVLDSLLGPVRDHPATAAVLGELVAEVAAVAQAEGVDLGGDLRAHVLAGLKRLPAFNGTSTLYDRRAGRPLEFDALTGAVLRRADIHGIAVPVVRTVHALLRWVSDAAVGDITQPEIPEPPG